MTAETQARRKVTARAVAEQIGCTTRTVRRIVAEPRPEFEARAKARRDQAVALREQGLKYREIAEAMEITMGSVAGLLHEARRLAPALASTPKKRRTQQTA